MITRLQALKLMQLVIALPAYTVPTCTTIAATLFFVFAVPFSFVTSLPPSAFLQTLPWVTLLLFMQWACWSIFADVLEDIPSVRHLTLLVFGLLLTLFFGAFAWWLFDDHILGLMCGSQGMAAGVLLVINLLRKRFQADES